LVGAAVFDRVGDAAEGDDRAGHPAEFALRGGVGIGVFLTFIGLKNAGFMVSEPVTFMNVGGSRLSW
jgi:xanthine/uracil/vitamin C permease (AzgA family)